MVSSAVALAKDWYCPNCDAQARTVDHKLPMHPCPGLGGLMVALVVHGVKCKIEAVERQDYIGREQVQYDHNRRPIMSILTTRDEGMDCRVLAPMAVASARD